MTPVAVIGVFLAGLLAAGLLSRLLAVRSITPQIVVMVLGICVGFLVRATPEVVIDTAVLHTAGELALILALFVDAARIDVGALRGTAGLPTRLLAIGLPLTIAAGVLAAVVLLPELTVLDAAILAVLIAPTDAALGAIVVSSAVVPLRIRQALNVESGLNDGLVTPLVLVAVAIAQSEEAGSQSGWLVDAVSQIGLGVAAGVAVGVGGALALRLATSRGWMLDRARWMAALAMALLAWVVAHELGGNVFVAAFVAGLASTAAYGRVPDAVLEFAELGGELLGLFVFYLFGVLVPTIGGYDARVVLFAILALTVVRMVPVAIGLAGARLQRSTVAFIGWFGPRGLATVVLTLVALGDGAEGPPPFAPLIVSAVAMTIVLSVLTHGLSAGPLVVRYGRFVERLPAGSPELDTVADLPIRTSVIHTTR
jgi:NhaP-type Na+/H+ or K+/H+ antiporter